MKTPVILLDRIGYAFYRDARGRSFLPADRYDLRLVTDVAKLNEATGPEIDAVIGVGRDNKPGAFDAVRFLHNYRGIPAQRLVAVTERLLLPAAELREELGIEGPTVEQTRVFRDKVRMKEHLRDNDIAVPDFAAYERGAAVALLAKHGKLIAKPRHGAGSIDVIVITDIAGIDAFEKQFADRLDDFDVEQFIDAPLYHVNCVIHEGKVVAAMAGRTLTDTTSYLRGEHWIDVNLGPGPVLDTLLDYNSRVMGTYPWFSGATHHEMFLTEDGPVFCEIASRAGGGGTLAGFLFRTGVSLDEAIVQAQTVGTVPAISQVLDHLTGFTMIYGSPGILLEDVSAPPESWVIEEQILAHKGDRLEAPSACDDAVAIISVRGESEHEVRQRLDHVIEYASPKVGTCA
nr:hypothetical protein [Kibdelosporangium sp. MJ126-NF4]CEL18026.1 hypothetical protein [Kibdelosporangium sp. MJ126-NF4]CTQ90746.1 hypothetical protein [Kibdelosporangium sp. MJ126-NF4]